VGVTVAGMIGRGIAVLLMVALAVVAAGCSVEVSRAIVWRTPLFGTMLRNNELLRAWETGIYGVPLPAGTDVLSRSSDFGLLEGNGNHCDVRVVLVLLTPLTPADVKAHYETSGIAERLAPTRKGLATLTATAAGEPHPDGRQRVRVELFGHGGNMGLEGTFDPRCT
jgi:hypothetical protein